MSRTLQSSYGGRLLSNVNLNGLRENRYEIYTFLCCQGPYRTVYSDRDHLGAILFCVQKKF
jgi:hypothetical protein